MMDDAADLSRLADIVVPAPVPWWPPAPGWWILAAGLLAAIFLAIVAMRRRWRREAYRRLALAEIESLGPVTDAAGVAALSAVLKRTALAAYPRERVASLTGADWVAFLDRTGGTGGFRAAGFSGAVSGAVESGPALAQAARLWVKSHRREDP